MDLKYINRSESYFVYFESCMLTDESPENTTYCPAASGIRSYNRYQNLVCYLHAFLNNTCSSVCLVLYAHGRAEERDELLGKLPFGSCFGLCQ